MVNSWWYYYVTATNGVGSASHVAGASILGVVEGGVILVTRRFGLAILARVGALSVCPAVPAGHAFAASSASGGTSTSSRGEGRHHRLHVVQPLLEGLHLCCQVDLVGIRGCVDLGNAGEFGLVFGLICPNRGLTVLNTIDDGLKSVGRT